VTHRATLLIYCAAAFNRSWIRRTEEALHAHGHIAVVLYFQLVEGRKILVQQIHDPRIGVRRRVAPIRAADRAGHDGTFDQRRRGEQSRARFRDARFPLCSFRIADEIRREIVRSHELSRCRS
jgi:hypothetical protein